jgi:glutamate carboxypeptidase
MIIQFAPYPKKYPYLLKSPVRIDYINGIMMIIKCLNFTRKCDYVHRGKNKMLTELLKRVEHYVNTDSNTFCKEDVDRFSSIIEAEGCEAGFKVVRHEQRDAGDFLEITAGSGNKNILLLGHMDTVFPRGTAAIRPFRHDGQKAYGPGVGDMKGGLLVIMQAMKKVAKDIPPDFSITALMNSDEENGSLYSNKLISEKASVAMAALSFEGAVPGTLTTERNGIISFAIDIKGVPAHSGANSQLGRSAIEEAAHKILRLYDLRDESSNITVNIGKISGGSARNIVAENAQFIGEIRYFDPAHRDGLLEKLTEAADKTIVSDVKCTLKIISHRPSMKSDEGCKELFELVRMHAAKMGRKLSPRKTGGGGDAAFAKLAGIPVIDGMGPEGGGYHTEDEYVLLDSIMFKIELAAETMLSIMKV